MQELEKLYYTRENTEFNTLLKEYMKSNNTVSDFLIYGIIERGDIEIINKLINEYKVYIDKKFISWAIRHSQLITCLKSGHGDFEQQANNHLNGQGCPKCGKIVSYDKIKLTKEEFIEKAKNVHKDKYSYDKVDYNKSIIKVVITCLESGHGDFEQNPNSHLRGSGCPKCSGNKKITTEEFIVKAKNIHKDKYSYDKVKYINLVKKVIITCLESEHGDFEQIPHNHLIGHGCPKCGVKKKSTTEEFIEKAKNIHKDKYSYDKVKYINSSTRVIITCLESGHGDFEQKPNNHLIGHGCSKCVKICYSKVCIEFLNTFPFNIKHAENGGEEIIKIKDKIYKADGYIKVLNSEKVDDIFSCHKGVNKYRNINSLEIVIEFHGCFWHGCPTCYPYRNEINSVNYKTYKELYEDTCKKKEDIINSGYNYIEIWECQYKG